MKKCLHLKRQKRRKHRIKPTPPKANPSNRPRGLAPMDPLAAAAMALVMSPRPRGVRYEDYEF